MGCECAICKNNNVFSMPEDIVEAYKSTNLVLFCGAGISTENKNAMPYTFYSDVCNDLNISTDNSFSHVMSMFCKQNNGRRKLLRKIKDRFDYISSFPELQRNATRFHRELSMLYNVQTIITTNWDDYFEKYCAATPITIPEDFVFWDCCDRSVIKIHGSINNLSTIVATDEDYEKCTDSLQKGVIGATIKSIFATKTVVFIGFSFGDDDFSQIFNYINDEMKDLMPHIYVVTLDDKLDEKLSYHNLTTIVTDGTYFIHQLKNILIDNKMLENIQAVDFVEDKYFELKTIHQELAGADYKLFPEILYCLSYQDGTLHAFERFMQYKQTGKYFIPGFVRSVVRFYNDLLHERHQQRNYWDSSYFEGYLNGLLYIVCCDDSNLANAFPMFYLPNAKKELPSIDVLFEELKRVAGIKGKYQKYANELLNEREYDGDIVLHHPPY